MWIWISGCEFRVCMRASFRGSPHRGLGLSVQGVSAMHIQVCCDCLLTSLLSKSGAPALNMQPYRLDHALRLRLETGTARNGCRLALSLSVLLFSGQRYLLKGLKREMLPCLWLLQESCGPTRVVLACAHNRQIKCADLLLPIFSSVAARLIKLHRNSV